VGTSQLQFLYTSYNQPQLHARSYDDIVMMMVVAPTILLMNVTLLKILMMLAADYDYDYEKNTPY
jgi:hypothetical protein